jgi:hypothetical protein
MDSDKENLIKNDGGEAIYLFCLAGSGHLSAIEGTGVDGRSPLFQWNLRDITAVLSMACVEEFSGPSGESRMEDLAWVGPRACHHEAVIEGVMRHSPVLPARFGTLFSSLESLKKLLTKHYDTISEFLDRVTDKEEWAVKGLLDRDKARERFFSMILATDEADLSLSPGMHYFQEQRIQAEFEKELSSWLNVVLKRIASDIARHASDFSERRPLSQEVTGKDTDMVLNWAFLVPRNAMADFRAEIDRANSDQARQGLVFELSGPWPPYSFCPSLRQD